MKTPILLRISFIVMILLLSVTVGKAQTTYTWTGTTSTAWATTTNWSPAGNRQPDHSGFKEGPLITGILQINHPWN